MQAKIADKSRTRNVRAFTESKSAYFTEMPQKTSDKRNYNKFQVTLHAQNSRKPPRKQPEAELTLQVLSLHQKERCLTHSNAHRIKQRDAVSKVKLMQSFFAGLNQQRKVKVLPQSVEKVDG